jgi:MraZ protein
VLFTGHSEHTIDAKLRLAIPAKYRNLWNAERDGGAWFCVPWPTGLLRLYTEAAFNRMADQEEASLTPDERTAELEASYYAFAERLEMDSAGRIVIPRSHIEMTGLASDVMVVGARNRLEVCDAARWNATRLERFRALPTLVRPAHGGSSTGGGPNG